MRIGFLLLFGSFHFGAPIGRAPVGDRWFGPDKAKHFAVSAVVQGVSHGIVRSAGYDYRTASSAAAVSTLTVGVGKELWDRSRGRVFSWKDIGADVAGGVSGAVAMRQVDR
jgi:putative lipoprotein